MNQSTKAKTKTKTNRQRKYQPQNFWFEVNRDFEGLYGILPPDATADQVEWWERHLKPKAWGLLNDVAHASFRNGRLSRDQQK